MTHHHHDHDDYVNDGTHSFVDEHVRDGYGVEEMTDKMKRAGFSVVKSPLKLGSFGFVFL